ncbi:DNA repair protein RecN [Lachnotalea sp. AF33-28]|uniref:DNA repair protein RecN n=1 Tax=Lachnotalea sp. AF33-28 TaxID=2292046 RepID=UPI000E521BEE|nr:DNA repair protein RecN [Lachnotalea sp. AF33-28]RHP33307.1 DNA repair protein RecN [Lachnotalea sp. AF33-28]
MLTNLHVKNFALIDEIDVAFEPGLNILTGETGAGKSIIIDSVNIALGGKVPAGIIRRGAEYAYIELIFTVEDKDKLMALKAMDIIPEDNMLILTKKIMNGRSISKINDETVTASKIKQVTSLLIDIHGQHEHQSLLYKSKHLEILDAFAKPHIAQLKKEIQVHYQAYVECREKLSGFTMDEEKRLRELDFTRFEINEIEAASLKSGEEEELEGIYRRISNSRKIGETLGAVMAEIGYEDDAAAGERMARAVRELQTISGLDKKLEEIHSALLDLESLLSDVNRSMADYMDNMSFDEETYKEVTGRLDLIRNLQAKYGGSYEKIMEYLDEKYRRLAELENYEENRRQTQQDLKKQEESLDKLCAELSGIRKEEAKKLCISITKALKDLNFLDVRFSMQFSPLGHYSKNGYDEAEFLISTNPGEELAPLGKVASGGELSRIMLAMKTVLADTDDIPTLIFDEIDTGISGRTAQKVSEKLSIIGRKHQVLCITHLPQIAAMADHHFLIEKGIKGDKVTTSIQMLDSHDTVRELARLLGGAAITDTVLKSAEEMKELAEKTKTT